MTLKIFQFIIPKGSEAGAVSVRFLILFKTLTTFEPYIIETTDHMKIKILLWPINYIVFWNNSNSILSGYPIFRAVLYFLCCHYFAPTLTVWHWIDTYDYNIHRIWINVIPYWNWVLSLDNEHFIRNVSKIDYNRSGNICCNGI